MIHTLPGFFTLFLHCQHIREPLQNFLGATRTFFQTKSFTYRRQTRSRLNQGVLNLATPRSASDF